MIAGHLVPGRLIPLVLSSAGERQRDRSNVSLGGHQSAARGSDLGATLRSGDSRGSLGAMDRPYGSPARVGLDGPPAFGCGQVYQDQLMGERGIS